MNIVVLYLCEFECVPAVGFGGDGLSCSVPTENVRVACCVGLVLLGVLVNSSVARVAMRPNHKPNFLFLYQITSVKC